MPGTADMTDAELAEHLAKLLARRAELERLEAEDERLQKYRATKVRAARRRELESLGHQVRTAEYDLEQRRKAP